MLKRVGMAVGVVLALAGASAAEDARLTDCSFAEARVSSFEQCLGLAGVSLSQLRERASYTSLVANDEAIVSSYIFLSNIEALIRHMGAAGAPTLLKEGALKAQARATAIQAELEARYLSLQKPPTM